MSNLARREQWMTVRNKKHKFESDEKERNIFEQVHDKKKLKSLESKRHKFQYFKWLESWEHQS